MADQRLYRWLGDRVLGRTEALTLCKLALKSPTAENTGQTLTSPEITLSKRFESKGQRVFIFRLLTSTC